MPKTASISLLQNFFRTSGERGVETIVHDEERSTVDHPGELDELRGRLDELPKDKELLISCQVGLRGHVACRLLSQHGFKVKNLSGGFKTWQLAIAE